jgi:hypothetical protein
MQVTKITASAFTRPNDTTAYASGDLVANSTTAGSVTPMTFPVKQGRMFKILKAELTRSAASVTNAAFRLHLYRDSPTVANGDNGAWSSTASGYEGFIDIAAPGAAFSATAVQHGIYVNNALHAPMVAFLDTDRKLYGLLEARGAYTPTAQETFTVALVGEAYA